MLVDKASRAYSVRLSAADLRKLKVISQRLLVTESDVVRFSLRHVLRRLAPLHDVGAHGPNLLPAFVEFGDEMTSYFDLDESSLDRILNQDIEAGRRVDREDIGMLLMLGLEETRLRARLAELLGEQIDPDIVSEKLTKYLCDKYFRRGS